jgi:7-cyano-7-deazaguanine synthase
MKKALVVLSGGQDSTTCLYWAKEHYDEVHSISFDYGQRHRIELEAADTIAFMAHVESHRTVDIREVLRSSSPLTSQATLEQYVNYEQMDKVIGDRVELTFVPMRNTTFLTVAANHAVAMGIDNLVTGICQEDNANYPDCRESFRRQMEILINKSLGYEEEEFSIQAPLMFMSKAQSVLLALKLKGCYPALAWSHTSYDGKYPPTDNNHSNLLRAHGFEVAGVPDPLVIRAYVEGLMPLPVTPNYEEYRATATLPRYAK